MACNHRKSFTVTERLAIAQRIAERLQGRHGGDRKTDQEGNISHLIDQGRTKDLAAAKAGLGSGKTLEAAQKVVAQGAPELVAAMDEGKVSIHAAARIAELPREEQRGNTRNLPVAKQLVGALTWALTSATLTKPWFPKTSVSVVTSLETTAW